MLLQEKPSTDAKYPKSYYADRIEAAKFILDDFKRLKAAGLLAKHDDFTPSVHYPPITMYPEITQEELLKDYTLPADGLLDLYLHIPFCRTRCVFCHYPVQLGEKTKEKSIYLEAFEKEIKIYLDLLGLDKFKGRSILVGGGTPTFLTLEQQQYFFDIVNSTVDLSQVTQYNFDVDPNTLIGPEGRDRLRMMRDNGADRLTIGVQSLNEHVLQLMNRHHGKKEVYEAIENCHEFGFIVDIEFIFGYPGETIENWIDVMEEAVNMGVEEIQLYRLKVEAYGDYQGTIKAVKEKGLQAFPSYEETMLMKQVAHEILNENGYNRNLRRVFSKKREHFSHYADNQCCGLLDQLGFGLTAFSSLRDRFGLNVQTFDDYYESIKQGRLPLNRGYVRTTEDQARWSIILPLKNRTLWKEYFKQVSGGFSIDEHFRAKIDNLKAFGLLIEDEEKIELTTLGGFFADQVVQQFHAPEFMPYPASDFEDGPLHPYKNNQF